MLIDEAVSLSESLLSERAAQLLALGRAAFSSVKCFDFVPSDYELVWRVLSGLPRGRFCEWGSGLGIVTGLAEILGFTALGIEVDADLAQLSRELLGTLGLRSPIYTGDYLERNDQADYYFVYCWPGSVMATEAHFETIAPQSARVLICHGQSDVRIKVRALCARESE